MNLNPINQLQLYGLENELYELISLFEKKKLPNKILFSGRKGIGKCTLAYHLINYILSKSELLPYDKERLLINKDNKSFKLIINGSNPNFHLIDVAFDKKNIDIEQIRTLITNINKSSFNDKPRIILIDNTEYLNKSSVNALLKSLEEPNKNTYFILINNQQKLLKTLTSRCINFNINLSNYKSIEVINKLLDDDIHELINDEMLNYYFSPGNLYKLFLFCKKNELNIKELRLKEFLEILINENYFKKVSSLNYLFYDYIETFLVSSSKIIDFKYYNYFIKKLHEMKLYNLDEDTFFLEFKSKILNG